MISIPSNQTGAATTSRGTYILELTTVFGLLAVFLSTMSVNDAVNGGFWAKLFLLARMATLILICTWFLRRDGQRWRDVGLRRPPRWWLVPLLVIGGFFFLILSSGFIFSTILPALGLSPPQLKISEFAGDLPEFLFFMIFVGWGSAAFGEEMLMRGFVIDRLCKVIGSSETAAVLVAIVLQGVLFGFLHSYQGLGGVLVTGFFGLSIGLIWLLSGRNLWACIILHGLINMVTDYEAYTATAPTETPAVSPMIVHAVGRVGGPAHYLQSYDGGTSWQSRDLGAQTAAVSTSSSWGRALA